ncbi:glycerophosphoryl diester phosphodiesterase membrane domain-containing protein [Clostridium polynesiense]|uniref:glycerophosphoryl diester phosphodiesterase membrane domain-containing protein n=1 Tax=Clostridium polynesiense TaxID=1325933 RepID=UPI00058DCF0A|nr:glycerophosphoryl diester phosphodiesterase membrane domain-containing protein [Clostridium polynesiense]
MEIMSLSQILDRSIDVLRKKLKTLVLFNLAYSIIVGVIAFISIMLGAVIFGVVLSLSPSDFFMVLFISLLILVASTFAVSIYVGMISISAEEFTGYKVTVQKAISLSFKALPKIFLILIMVGISLLPAIGVFWFIIKSIVESFETNYYLNIALINASWIPLLGVPLLLMIAVSAVMLIYFSLFSFSFHAGVIEGKGAFSAIKKSIMLVRKNFWRIVLYNFVFVITVAGIRYSLQAVVSLIIGIVFLLGKLFNANSDFKVLLGGLFGILSGPINIMTWLIVTPIGGIFTTMLYYNQRFKIEGLDLELRIKKLRDTMKGNS